MQEENFKMGIMLHILSSQTEGMFLSICDLVLCRAIRMTKAFRKSTHMNLIQPGRNGRGLKCRSFCMYICCFSTFTKLIFLQAFGKSAKAFESKRVKWAIPVYIPLRLRMCTWVWSSFQNFLHVENQKRTKTWIKTSVMHGLLSTLSPAKGHKK